MIIYCFSIYSPAVRTLQEMQFSCNEKTLANIDDYKVKLYSRVKLLTDLGHHAKSQNIYEEIDLLTRAMASTIPSV